MTQSRTAYELAELLKKRNMKAASAESLTGGLVSKLITDIPGASQIFELGVCSYSNRIKHEVLGVSEETLENYTEYSYQTACEMAQGVRRLSGADIGISTTGIAGPSGGTEEKPVGTVYIGVSTGEKTFAEKFSFGDDGADRDTIRIRACISALKLALETVT